MSLAKGEELAKEMPKYDLGGRGSKSDVTPSNIYTPFCKKVTRFFLIRMVNFFIEAQHSYFFPEISLEDS